MRATLRALAAGALLAIPAAAQTAAPAPASPHAAAVRAVADEYVRASVARFPGTAEQVGDDTPPDRWVDNSPAAIAAWDALQDGLLARLAAVDEAALFGTPDWLTYGMLREQLEAQRAARVCRGELWGVDQIFGWHLSLVTAAARQPVDDESARRIALARWRALPAFVDTEIANARTGLAQGYAAPRDNVARVIEQLQGMIVDSLPASPLWSPAARDSSPGFREAWAGMLREQVNPSLRRFQAFLRDEYLPRARAEPGLHAIPQGAACYRAIIRGYTSLDLAPEELRDRARAARREMEAELAPLATRLAGVAEPRAARRVLKTDARFAYGSREAKLAQTRAQLDRLREMLPRAFSRVPSSPLALEVVPAFQERSAPPAWYESAPLDGSRPGTYFTNLGGAEQGARMELAPSTTHEGWPGHHMQQSWVRERPVSHPVQRLLGTGSYTEGWGMYAERLAYEEGMFGDDDLMKAGILGHLVDALVGLEADPGIHVFGWTREAAVDSMMAISGRPRAQAESYADRHAATPGQLASYMTGYLEIVRLREEARRALGPRFDLRAFHDVVLDDGGVTLPMLRTKVQRWIEQRRAAR
jgi:uncharacterized protein (DUF885 family)